MVLHTLIVGWPLDLLYRTLTFKSQIKFGSALVETCEASPDPVLKIIYFIAQNAHI